MIDIDNMPDDEDGQALRQLAADGSDLDKPMVINFPVECPNEESAMDVAAAAMEEDFDVDVWANDPPPGWTCECSMKLIPDYDDLQDVQKLLSELAAPYGAAADGWGTFGNAR